MNQMMAGRGSATRARWTLRWVAVVSLALLAACGADADGSRPVVADSAVHDAAAPETSSADGIEADLAATDIAQPDGAPSQTDAVVEPNATDDDASDTETTDLDQIAGSDVAAASDAAGSDVGASTDDSAQSPDTQVNDTAADDAMDGDTAVDASGAVDGSADGSGAGDSDAPTATDTQDPDAPDAAVAPLGCGPGGLRVVGSAPWAGGGVQLWVELPIGVSLADAAPSLLVAGGAQTTGAVAAAQVKAGWSVVVVVPALNLAEHAARLEAAAALVASLPDHERIAVVVSDAVGALTVNLDLADDRPTLLQRVAAIAPAAAAEPSDSALQALALQLADAGDPWSVVARDVLVVGALPAVIATPSATWPERVGLHAVVASSAGLGAADGVSPVAVQSWSTQTPAEAATALGTALVVQRANVWRLGFCAEGAKGAALLQWSTASCAASLPKPLAHLSQEVCVATAAAADAYVPPVELELQLSPAQEQVWQDYYNTLNKADFDASFWLGEGTPIAAKANFRGQSSLGCARKSYKINLQGNDDRRLFAGGGGDEFLLLSMCLDRGYLNQVFANRLLAEVGLFPLQHRYVRLKKNGENQGIYLLLQDPEDTLQRRQLGLAGLVRRQFEPDPNVAPEVKVPNADPELSAVLADYLSVGDLAMTAPEKELPAVLDAKLDSALYWRWMAAMTLLGNGDYIDETYFYAMNEHGGLRWRPMGWDADDLFSACHHNAEFALPDPNGMVYCAEGRIDNALTRSDAVYAQWVAELAGRIAAWDDQTAAAVMNPTLAELQALLDDPTAAALVEANPPLPTGAAAKAFVAERAGKILAKLAANRTALKGKIATWQAAQPIAAQAPAAVPAPQSALQWRGVRSVPPGAKLPLVVASTAKGASLQVQVLDATGPIGGFAVRRGAGSLPLQAPAQPGPWTLTLQTGQATQQLVVEVAERPQRLLSGTLAGQDLLWDASADVVLTANATVPAGETLTIGPGTRVRLGANVRLTVLGNLQSGGTPSAPVWLLPAGAAPWGEVEVSGSASFANTWFSGGGGDPTRVFGHSASQPVVRVNKSATLALSGGGLVDNPGKALGSTGATLVIEDALISRCDTGGEHEGSSVTLRRSHVLEIPDADGVAADDDNDGIYLADNKQSGAQSVLEDCIFERGEDDAIDHNGANVTIRRTWLRDFAHEGIAASNGGSVTAEDLVVSECDQGVEAGYGGPKVSLTRGLLHHNGVGLRWGDSYPWEATGTLTVTDTQVTENSLHNVWLLDEQQGAPTAGLVQISCSRVGDAAWDAVASNAVGAIAFSLHGQLRWQPLRPTGCGWLGPKLQPDMPPVQTVVLQTSEALLGTEGVAAASLQLAGQVQPGVQLAWSGGWPRPQLTLQVDAPGDWYGLGSQPQSTLVLTPLDAALGGVRQWLTMALLRQSGSPAPQVGIVALWLNGQWRGLYSVQEAVDQTFLQNCGLSTQAGSALWRAPAEQPAWIAPASSFVSLCCAGAQPAALQPLLDAANADPAGQDYATNLLATLAMPPLLAQGRVRALSGQNTPLLAASALFLQGPQAWLLPTQTDAAAWQLPPAPTALWTTDTVLDGWLALPAHLSTFEADAANDLQTILSAERLTQLMVAAQTELAPWLDQDPQTWPLQGDGPAALTALQEAVLARRLAWQALLP